MSAGLIGAGASLASLFGASFLVSTLIPINPEVALWSAAGRFARDWLVARGALW